MRAFLRLTTFWLAINLPGLAQPIIPATCLDQTLLDSATRPGDDFYQFANGHWLARTRLAPGQSFYMPLIAVLEANTRQVDRLIQELAQRPRPTGSPAQLVGDYYASGLDTGHIETLASRPLYPFLRWIDAMHSKADLVDILAQLIRVPTNPLLRLRSEPDPTNPQRYVATLSASGLNLPPLHYTDQTASAQTVRSHYQAYLYQLLLQLGLPRGEAQLQARRVLRLEQQLARLQTGAAPTGTHASYSPVQLQTLTPGLNWDRILTLSALHPQRVYVLSPTYYHGLDSLLHQLPLATWRAKLKIDYLLIHAPRLSRTFYEPYRRLRMMTTPAMVPAADRSELLRQDIRLRLKDALGHVYVARYTADTTKQQILALFIRIRAVLTTHLQQATWLSVPARQAAQEKLSQLLPKLAYPDQWPTYTGLRIRRDDYFGNAERLAQWGIQQNLALLEQPTDRGRWRFPVFGAGSSYSQTENSLTLAAGYLQPPLYQPDCDAAVLYGTLGTTLAHELAHGFDNQGCRYDALGEQRSWWSATDSAAFAARCAPLVVQFNGYTVQDTLRLNGHLTLGENMADLVGLTLAYEAFTQTEAYRENQRINGLTPAQRFFLSFAQTRRSVYSATGLREQVSRVWPPEYFRVNGPLSNFTPFYEAFGLKPGDALYKAPADRIQIW